MLAAVLADVNERFSVQKGFETIDNSIDSTVDSVTKYPIFHVGDEYLSRDDLLVRYPRLRDISFRAVCILFDYMTGDYKHIVPYTCHRGKAWMKSFYGATSRKCINFNLSGKEKWLNSCQLTAEGDTLCEACKNKSLGCKYFDEKRELLDLTFDSKRRFCALKNDNGSYTVISNDTSGYICGPILRKTSLGFLLVGREENGRTVKPVEHDIIECKKHDIKVLENYDHLN